MLCTSVVLCLLVGSWAEIANEKCEINPEGTPCAGTDQTTLIQSRVKVALETDALEENTHTHTQLQMKASPSRQMLKTASASPDRLLYVGVISGPANRQRRDEVRSSWLNEFQKNHTNDGRIFAEFIIGHAPFTSKVQGSLGTPEQLKLEDELRQEAEAHGDIRRIALPEKYEYLPDKVLLFLQQGLQQEYSFLLKIDDDQVLDVDATKRFVALHSPDELLYAGVTYWDHKEYDSQLGTRGDFVPYFGGPCYLLSWGLAHKIVEVHGAHTAAFMNYGSSSEDVDMGRWVQWESGLGGNVTYSKLFNGSRGLELQQQASMRTSMLSTWQQAWKEDPTLFEGCSKVFVDVGSNRGTHVRKLFEPKKYPGCPYLAVFNESFGTLRSGPSSLTGICAFGFEANPRWSSRLKEIEKAYAAQGWRARWFAPAFVSNKTGSVTLWLNDNGTDSDWGASSKHWNNKPAKSVEVPAIDLSGFMQQLRKQALPGHKLMKMDIESAEFQVLPKLLEMNLLCKSALDKLTIEWHERFLEKDEIPAAKRTRQQVESSTKCTGQPDTIVQDFDDESFLTDGMPLP